MSARRWPTDRYTFREPHRPRPWWLDALDVLLVCVLSVLVLGVLVPALWVSR